MGNGVYERVKSYVVSNELPAGKRIMVEPIADRLFVSATPVREALIRLAAERMIDDVPKTGFFVKRLSESEIEGLYHLQHLLLGWSLKVIGNDNRVPGILAPPNLFEELQAAKNASSQVAMHIKQELFVHISRQCGNDDISFLIRNINDRTYYACKRDYEIYGDEKGQLLRLCRAYYQRDFDKLHADLRTYFHEKIDRIPNLLRVVRNDFLKTSA
ncbi:MAG: GntR family transcriptional regulator [Pseudomonadota bacterium]